MTPVLAAGWLHESVIGVEVWQFLGIAVLLAIIVLLRYAVLRLVWYALRRRIDPERHEFWAREQKRVELPVLLLVGALTILIGFPVLDFDRGCRERSSTPLLRSPPRFAATLLGSSPR